MKHLKKSLLVLSMGIMMALPVQAQPITTIGGVVDVPNEVTVSTLSNSKMLDLVEQFANERMKSEGKTVAVSTSSSIKKAGSVSAKRDKFRESLGKDFDIYGLSGKDAKGVKTAELFAVKLDSASIGKYLMKDMGPLAMMDMNHLKLSPVINALDPIMETAFIQNVNAQLPTLDTKINAGIVASSVKNPKNLVDAKVKFEDWEPLQSVNGTHYKTYTMGTRALLDVNGFQLPYYVNAAVVASGDNPTLYVILTSDVERNYFKPVMAKIIKSVK